jgi:hypothetical protein
MTVVPSAEKACGDCTLCGKVMASQMYGYTSGNLEIPDMVLRTIPDETNNVTA